VITFHHVSFSRPGDVAVLRDLGFDVRPGEVLALVGRSGAGKSTILKLINRLLDPQSGRVEVDGRDTRVWDPYRLRRRVGYVLQEVGLFPHMTVERNVGLVPSLEGWPAGRVRSRAHELLELVGLDPVRYAARWPAELSGGERQRVGVARALALDPPILLLDEPFASLDPVTRLEMHRELQRIQTRVRKTVMLVTHDMAEAFALADRLGVLHDGRLVAYDTPPRIREADDPRIRILLDAARLTPVPGSLGRAEPGPS
jgi:osmoprotectant transport system ATP-binding protein